MRPHTKDPIVLTEHVRQRLARTICRRYCDQDHRLHVVTLDPVLEERIRAGCEHSEEGSPIRLSPREVDGLCRSISRGSARS